MKVLRSPDSVTSEGQADQTLRSQIDVPSSVQKRPAVARSHLPTPPPPPRGTISIFMKKFSKVFCPKKSC